MRGMGKEKFVDFKTEEMNGEQTALIHFFFCEICYVFPLCLLLPLASYTLNAEKFIVDMCDMCFFSDSGLLAPFQNVRNNCGRVLFQVELQADSPEL